MPAILFSRDAASEEAAYNAQTDVNPILTFVGVWGGLALISVMLRLYVRKCMLRFVAADDWVMAAAMAIGVAVYGCFIGESLTGLGRHVSALNPEELLRLLHWQFFHSLILLVTVSLVKISIALLLLRLVKHRNYRYFFWGLVVFLAVYTLICVFTIIFACVPVSANWDSAAMKTAKCFPTSTYVALGVVNSAIGMATDVLLALVPIPVVLSLQLRPRTKGALAGVLSLGLIAVGAGAVKVHAQLTVLDDKDRFFHDRYFVWAAIECYIAIVAASLPTLKPLLAVFLNYAQTTMTGSGEVREQPSAQSPRSGRTDDSVHKHNKTGTMTSVESCSDFTSDSSSPSKSKPGKSSVFSIFRKGSYDIQTECSRSGSIQLGTVTWTDQPPMPAVDAGRIMRTTKVTTTSEARHQAPPDQWPLAVDALDRDVEAGEHRVQTHFVTESEQNLPSVMEDEWSDQKQLVEHA